MEEEGHGRGWMAWLIIVPVCMLVGALLAKWALSGWRRPPAPAQAPLAAAAPAPEPGKRTEDGAFDLPGDDQAGDASVVWSKDPAGGTKGAAQPGAQSRAAGRAEEKNYRATGSIYGALTKAAGGLLKDPKAMAALFNNDYVVKGFMSRDTVKAATASGASLAAYLKDPANLSKFMAKGPVQAGLNDQQLVGAVASSKLAAALLDTPGGKALLNDPAAIAGVLKDNPALLDALLNPNVLTAMAQNPKTAGIVGQLMSRGGSR